MSVVYGRWEVASVPTMGYNMSVQGNMCASAETLAPETANYSGNTLLAHESVMKAVAAPDTSKGLSFPNNRALTPQDAVVRGLSSLSLHPQLQLHQARSPSANLDASPSCESSSKSLELQCNTHVASNERNFCCFEACLTGCCMQRIISGPLKTILQHSRSGVTGFEDVCGVSSVLSRAHSADGQGSASLTSFQVATRSSLPHRENCETHNFLDVCHRPKHKLDVVVEDKPFEETVTGTMNDDLDLDTISSSSNSVSSVHDISVDGSVSSGEVVHGVGDSEVQSVCKGSSSCTGCEGGSPSRKGLSRFYAGKSRSFSCLADAMSVRDLAKPENPYAKKRRCHASRSGNDGRTQLPPLQKGAASISKKALHNGKATLALAVAMSSREVVIDEEKDDQSSKRDQRNWQRSPITSRSYSLSDLQRATKSQVLIETRHIPL